MIAAMLNNLCSAALAQMTLKDERKWTLSNLATCKRQNKSERETDRILRDVTLYDTLLI